MLQRPSSVFTPTLAFSIVGSSNQEVNWIKGQTGQAKGTGHLKEQKNRSFLIRLRITKRRPVYLPTRVQTCAKPGKVSCAYLRFASALGFLEAARRLILTVWSDPVEFCVGNLPLSLLVKGQGGRILVHKAVCCAVNIEKETISERK